jgi:small subunit ribosomal protein S16
MLAIRMQRTGRSGHAQFRVVVQDSRYNPKSGRVVAYVGSYNPHTKAAALDGESLSKYLENGAQPSERVARLLKKEGIKLPAWVKLSDSKERSVRNPEKRRSTAPKEEAKPTPISEPESQPKNVDNEEATKVEAAESEVELEKSQAEESNADSSKEA